MTTTTRFLRSSRRLAGTLAALLPALGARAQFNDPNADANALPTVPQGFAVSVFAREPHVRQPCSMTFDAQGRLFVGMGPQYRSPKPDTAGDSVVLVLDTDHDGRADTTKVFATGFNAIQGLAWHGRDLWIANAPDLTVVQDLDGDDIADRYTRVFTDLGNLEHGLHGLNWGPDGRLYMSKGNSKGLTQPGRIAPRPFRDLWGVTAPPGSPDFPDPVVTNARDYRRNYHDPDDDWGREGGVLRCDDGGRNLEIVARGFRNPWDIAFDSGFNWLGTDNDQSGGDRVFMPFHGAHFGWNHPWSSEWADRPAGPSAPVAGPLFEGSGTGLVFADSPAFPPSHRGVFFINDWLAKVTYLWRPAWDGALLRPANGTWEPFVSGGPALFRPTDIEVGPDGALWILGWGRGYGAEWKQGELASEGRVFRVTWKDATATPHPRPAKPIAEWSPAELTREFESPVAVRRTDAQEELLRRGESVRPHLTAQISNARSGEATVTWSAWTLGRLTPADTAADAAFVQIARDTARPIQLRVQAVRILADRALRAARRPAPDLVSLLNDPAPRVRHAAIGALHQTRSADPGTAEALLASLARETDRTTFYAGWQALRSLAPRARLLDALDATQPGSRRAALLALLEDNALPPERLQRAQADPDPAVQALARDAAAKLAAGSGKPVLRGRPLDSLAQAAGTPGQPASSAAGAPPGSPIRKLQARNAGYQLARAGLTRGARPYSDRNYRIEAVPKFLEGADFIRTANEDDGSAGNDWIRFEALVPMRVHVALDSRNTRPPAWLTAAFKPTGESIAADHWRFNLFTRDVPPGPVVLGGNTDDGKSGGKGQYIVVLEPLPPAAHAAPTRQQDALAALDQGDRERGEFLFHHVAGSGCASCHRLAGHGNAFGPDLAGIALRAPIAHLVQSLLEPDAVITEGFAAHHVEADGDEFDGVLLEESGLGITLGLASGERVSIPRASIRKHEVLPRSAMPSFAQGLTPVQVADLVAYLRHRSPSAGTTAAPAAATAPTGPARTPAPLPAPPAPDAAFSHSTANDRVAIRLGTLPIAEFIFRDPAIFRPYLAHLRAPHGMQVTRNHPPRPGVDPDDHATMHPGLWYGFGDISGADFWRNKARMEHDGFEREPAVADGRLRFATRSRLVAPDGSELGRARHELTFSRAPDAWIVGWSVEFQAGPRGLVFGDQEEMGFGARVATPLAEKSGGRLLASTGIASAKATWGQAADWCDYSGLIDGHPCGILLLAHPANFRPSWWHNRDYGVFVANPFGRAAMKQGPPSAHRIEPGASFRIRHAAVIHSGSALDEAGLRKRYAEGISGF